MNKKDIRITPIKLYHYITSNKTILRNVCSFFEDESFPLFGKKNKYLNSLIRFVVQLPEEKLNNINEVYKLISESKRYEFVGLDLEKLIRVYNGRSSFLQDEDELEKCNQFLKEQQKIYINNKNHIQDLTSDEIEEIELEDEELPTTPLISKDIYDRLPPIINEVVDYVGNNDRTRDMFITGFLSSMSLFFKNVEYETKREDGSIEYVKPNLYTFICAKPASGKGKLKIVEDLFKDFYLDIEEMNERNRRIIDEYNAENKNVKKEYKQYWPVPPGNSSHASFIKTLKNNKGVCLLFEQEVDNLIKNNKSEWGDLSEMLRSGFHYETIKDSRLERGITTIENPYISVCVSGTLDQLNKMFFKNNSSENGLLSRFLFYYTSETNNKFNFFVYHNYEHLQNRGGKSVIEKNSHRLNEIRKIYDNDDIRFKVKFTEKQIDKINNTIGELYEHILSIFGEDSKAFLFRMSLLPMKLSIILTCIREGEKKINGEDFILNDDIPDLYSDEYLDINDIDVDIALDLYKIYLKHTSWIHEASNENVERLKERNKDFTITPTENIKVRIFNELEKNFKSLDVMKLYEKYSPNKAYQANVSRTINNWLKFNQIKKNDNFQKGHYIKIK